MALLCIKHGIIIRMAFYTITGLSLFFAKTIANQRQVKNTCRCKSISRRLKVKKSARTRNHLDAWSYCHALLSHGTEAKQLR